MKGQFVPRHFSVTISPEEARTLVTIAEDAITLSRKQLAAAQDDWRLDEREEEVLADLIQALTA